MTSVLSPALARERRNQPHIVVTDEVRVGLRRELMERIDEVTR